MVGVREAGLEGNGRKEEGEISSRVAAALVHLTNPITTKFPQRKMQGTLKSGLKVRNGWGAPMCFAATS